MLQLLIMLRRPPTLESSFDLLGKRRVAEHLLDQLRVVDRRKRWEREGGELLNWDQH
jgi:hypothetical protein